MKTIALEEVPPGLASLVAEVRAGEVVVVTNHERPVARLVSMQGRCRRAEDNLNSYANVFRRT